ncbi:MAG: MBL fold metallo-hydrolase [Limnochordia bacterium]|nr:MBL fold metallo-hydrolase [Limnochordia bacterium]
MRKKSLLLILCLVIGFGLITGSCMPFFYADIGVHFINVAGGDAILIHDLVSRKCVLIDGGSTDTGDWVVNYLKYYAEIPQVFDEDGNSTWVLDAIVSTNPDPNYLGGLIKVLENEDIKVNAFYYSGHSDYAANQELQKALASAELSPQTLTRNDGSLQIGKLSFDVLHPSTPEGYAEAYDSSIVLRLDYGKLSFLFAGAIGTQAEAEMLSDDANLSVDFLKMSQNWTPTSSSQFLKKVNPQGVIYSQEEEPSPIDSKVRENLSNVRSYWTNAYPDEPTGHSITFWINPDQCRIDAPQPPFPGFDDW